MLEKDINDLLQDYKYRKNILEEITLDDIEKWNNMDVDVDWDKITNKPSTFTPSTHTHNFEDLLEKPTTLEGYGITDVYTKDEIQDNTLNKFKAINGKVLVDTGFILGVKDGDNLISYNYGTSGAPTVKFGLSYDSDMYSYIDSYLGKLDLIASEQIYIRTPYLNLKVPSFSLSGSNGSFSVDVSDNKGNNKLYASIPAEFTDIVKAPMINIYSNKNTVLEGALWNSTYNINGEIKDGLHLSHENGKYLALAYKNASTGIYNSYMICDVEGVLRNDSDGDDWGPVRFEQNVFFRHGLKIGGGEDIILAGKGVNTRITALENVVTQGTGMVEWNNVLNKPNTFTPSSHKHAISDITNLQTTLDSKAPEKYILQFEGAISSDFRKKIIGTTDVCGFVKSFRKNDSTDACMPPYGAGLAWGQVGTHAMLYADINDSVAYIAAGNNNKLNWSKQIAWKDDLTSYSLKTHNHDTVYSKLEHTHNYAGSSTAGGPATSAITAKYPGVIWTATTQVGTWSALCKTTAYISFILSISMNQNSQCGYDTFLVSTGWESARIYQLGGNGYTDNSGYKLRLVKESGTQYTLEIKNDYGYNGAKTLDIDCRYIVTSHHDNIITYSKKFVASTNNAVMYSITTSPSSNILTDSISFSNLDSGTRGIGGTIGGSDYWRLVGGASTLDEGFVELATADNGTEPIMVSQYTGKFVTRTRRMYLLDSNGNTIIPGNLELENTKQILGKDNFGAYSNLITMDKYNQVNVGDAKKCDNVVLAAKSAKISAFDGTNTYTMYHSGNFNPSNYFSRSGQNTTNLNTCYDVGIYYYTDSTTGAPNRQYGHILNTVSIGNKYNGSTNWLSQLAFNTDDTIWHRSKVNSGEWTNWTKLVKTTDLNNYLPKSGGNVSGNIILNNTIKISSKDKSGTVRDLIWMNNTTAGEVVVGGGSNQVTFDIPTPKSLKIWCDGTQKSYEVYHSGNDPWRIKTLGKADMDTTLNSRGQGFLMKEAYNGTSSGYPKGYGNVLRMGGTGSNELFFEWCDGTAGMIYHRCLRDIGTSWTPWRRLAYADELSGYLPKSGGTMKGELALTQDKGIVSANVEGGTLLVETSSSVNVGKITKTLNLNCSLAYMNGARVLTQYNYASYVLPKTIFAGVFSPDKTIGTDSNTFYNYSKKTVYKSADCTVGTDRITISKAGVYKVTATWGGVPKSGTANTSAMRFIIQQRNSSAAIASKLDTITVTTLNRTAKSTISGLFECSANDYFIIFNYLCTVTFESEDVEIEIVRIS